MEAPGEEVRVALTPQRRQRHGERMQPVPPVPGWDLDVHPVTELEESPRSNNLDL